MHSSVLFFFLGTGVREIQTSALLFIPPTQTRLVIRAVILQNHLRVLKLKGQYYSSKEKAVLLGW